MNVVDALVVTLGLDASKFKEGAKQTDEALGKTAGSVQKTGKDMEAWGKNAAASISKLRNEVLGLLAVFTAGMGIKDFVSSTISSTASLGRMSANLNMSAKDLAMWQLANKNAGGSVEGMTAQLANAQKKISDYRLGLDNGETNVFRTLGGKEEDLKDTETLMRAQANIVKGLTEKYGIDVARSRASAMGISDDTFNLMKQGAPAIDRLRDANKGLGDAQAAASVKAEEFRKKWDLVQNRLESVGVNIVTRLLPILDRFANWLDDNQDKIEEWAEKVVKAIEDFIKTADDAAKSVGGWQNVLVALIALKVLSFAGSLVTMAAALVQVGSALGVIGGTAGTGALAVLGKLVTKGGVGAALLLHTDSLNAGEDAELAKLRARGDADFASRGMVSGGAAQSQAVDSLMAKGWTREQAVGIAANLKQESNFNPGAVGDGGKAYGIAQWHGDRQAEFKKQYGKDIKESSLEEQLVFLNHELRQGSEQAAGNKLKGATSVQDAAGIVSKHFERPRDTDVEIARRAQIATQIDAQERTRIAAASAANVVRMASVAGSKPNAGGNSTSSSQVNINGPINIATKATDADGIAKGIGPAITKHSFAFQANTGLA
jgi:hypothetical protein